MKNISDPAIEYSAGSEFDYSVWEPGTQIDLCNVPWDAQYRNVWVPGDEGSTPAQRRVALNTYINGLQTPHIVLRGGSPAKVDQPVRLPLSHNIASRYNYLRARNPLQPASTGDDLQKDYYYFILGTRYINPGVTEVMLQLDVFQTFFYDIELGRSYVDRGHIGVANANKFSQYGREFLTVPEGMDVGGEYRIIANREEVIENAQTVKYNILIASTVDLAESGGSITNPSDPPVLKTARGAKLQGIPSGATYYVMESGSNLMQYMNYWKDKPWITQGIISITLIPPIDRYLPNFDVNAGSLALPASPPDQMARSLGHELFPNWRNSSEINSFIPDRYNHVKQKFFTYPYMVIELTTFMGNPIILKPEAWNNPSAGIVERAVIVPPAQQIVFYPVRYNTTGPQDNTLSEPDPGEYYDMMTRISAFPSVALVNNSFAGYLAGSVHGRSQYESAADWSQQKAMRGAQVGYDNAMSGVNALRQQTDASNQYAAAQQGVSQDLARQNQLANAIFGGIGGTVSGLAGGPIGGAMGALGGVGNGLAGAFTLDNTLKAANQMLGNQVNQAWRSTDISNAQTQYIADANKGLAEFGAKGDYEQAMAAQNAKIQDAKMLQPTVSGQMGGEFLHLIYGGWRVVARWKLIDEAAIRTIGEHWLEYGYAVNQRVIPPKSLHVMSKFSYWRMTQAFITQGPIPEGFKAALRGIFEKGVTVYQNPDDIGNVDFAANTPKTGIAL